MKDLSGLEVQDYFRIVWKRRWYFLIVFFLVSGSGAIYASRRIDVYRSEARIRVDTSLSTISTRSGGDSVQSRVDLIREQLSSRTFLERMTQQMGLYNYGETSDFSIDRAIRAIQNGIKVDQVGERTFRIAYTGTDRDTARNVTRQITEELIRVSRRSTGDSAKRRDTFLEEHLAEAGRKLNEQTELIRQFKLTHQGKLPEQEAANMSALSGNRAQLSSVESTIQQARTRQETLDSQYNQNKHMRERLDQLRAANAIVPELSGVSPKERELAKRMEDLSRREAELTQLQAKYQESHPDVGRLKRDIGRLKQDVEEARADLSRDGTIVTEDGVAPPILTKAGIEEEQMEYEYARLSRAIEQEIEKREQERDVLLQTIRDYEVRLKTTPMLAQQLDILVRDEDFLRKQYEALANQKASAELTAAIETDKMNEVYQIIDEASLPARAESTRLQLALISVAIGLGLGVVSTFGRELLDGTIGSEDEASKVFKLPVLVVVPTVPKKSKKKAA